MILEITVNDKKYVKDIPPDRRLVDFLRYDLFLTGTKEGCGEGECGACTVLLDNKPVNSCLILAAQARDRKVETIEYVRDTIEGRELIAKFTKYGAVQCGFCTPGFIIIAYWLLLNGTSPSISKIKQTISGNLCRCTGYQQIFEAIQKTSESLNIK